LNHKVFKFILIPGILLSCFLHAENKCSQQFLSSDLEVKRNQLEFIYEDPNDHNENFSASVDNVFTEITIKKQLIGLDNAGFMDYLYAEKSEHNILEEVDGDYTLAKKTNNDVQDSENYYIKEYLGTLFYAKHRLKKDISKTGLGISVSNLVRVKKMFLKIKNFFDEIGKYTDMDVISILKHALNDNEYLEGASSFVRFYEELKKRNSSIFKIEKNKQKIKSFFTKTIELFENIDNDLFTTTRSFKETPLEQVLIIGKYFRYKLFYQVVTGRDVNITTSDLLDKGLLRLVFNSIHNKEELSLEAVMLIEKLNERANNLGDLTADPKELLSTRELQELKDLYTALGGDVYHPMDVSEYSSLPEIMNLIESGYFTDYIKNNTILDNP